MNTEKKSIHDLQKHVDEWIKKYGVRYFDEMTNLGILMEEVGELSRVMVRKYGEQSFKKTDKNNAEEELCDILWVVLCLSNQMNIDLEKSFFENLKKKTQRDKKRHIQNKKLVPKK